jgi:hypothetical protein
VPDSDLVALLQPLGSEDTAPVEPGAVGRAEVFDVPELVGDMETGVVARGELVVDDERALAAGGEVTVEDVPPIPDLEDKGLGGNRLGQGHSGLPGDCGHGGPPCLPLRLRGVFPGWGSSRVGTAMCFVRGTSEVIDTGHILMMAEGGLDR